MGQDPRLDVAAIRKIPTLSETECWSSNYTIPTRNYRQIVFKYSEDENWGRRAEDQTVMNSILTALHDPAVSTSTAYFLQHKSLELGTARNSIKLGAIRGEERLQSEFSEDMLYESGIAVFLSFCLVMEPMQRFPGMGKNTTTSLIFLL
jgi:hypothetical protein